VYAPGLTASADIAAVVAAVDAPVNVLALPAAPSIPELDRLGVRRVSTGSLLAGAAYGAMLAGARELQASGSSGYARAGLPADARSAAFAP
jgi:2-methylisocitrate lyase-like PEP mutase family enzyme